MYGSDGINHMIIKDEDVLKRLTSPMNLMNQLRNRTDKKNDAMSLFGLRPDGKKEIRPSVDVSQKQEEKALATFNPFQPLAPTTAPVKIDVPTTLDNILEDHESQVKLGLAHDNALRLLNSSVEMLQNKLDDIKADKLPSVISAASKTVESIRRERAESTRNGKDLQVHHHFYMPQQKSVADYNIIDVTETTTA